MTKKSNRRNVDTDPLNAFINSIGSNNFVAKTLEVTPAAVSRWRTRGIPPYRLLQLKIMFPDLCQKAGV